MSPIVSIEEPIAELYFGLVRAIGTDIEAVRSYLVSALRDALFVTRSPDESGEIRLSALFRQVDFLSGFVGHSNAPDRYNHLMDAGDLLRGLTKRPDAAALLGARAIRSCRQDKSTLRSPSNRRGEAYILRSLMRPEEGETLRKVYGSQYFTIAVFAPSDERERSLARQLAQKTSSTEEEMRPKAIELINRDLGLAQPELSGIEAKYCLDVRSTYQRADLFVSATDPEESRKAIRRFVELIFGQPFTTPTRDEYGMSIAYASSARSGDLSRRVGACALGTEGEVIATGTNEVPRQGGGFYWTGDTPDGRDYQQGGDHSDRVRRELLTDVVRRLKIAEAEGQGVKLSQADLELAVQKTLESKEVRKARALDVVEYSRAVHAEMAVITDAARRGVSLKGTDLYCTTFPCHECARLIVASGIRRVVYIEPYPKSRVSEMYADSIGLADRRADLGSRVRFEPFVGIAPRRFSDLFSWVPRKNADSSGAQWMSGKPVEWSLARAEVRPSILDAESLKSGARRAAIETGENHLIEAFEERLDEISQEVPKATDSPK